MSVKYGGENEYLIAPAGTIYPLAEYGVRVSGLGDIPAEYQTRRGYRQHGVTVQDWRLATRALSFNFAVDARTRPDYWSRRQALIDALRPNLGATITYRRVLPDGSRRQIDGWLQAGMTLQESDDGRAFTAGYELLCPDPSFYDPAQQTVTLATGTAEALAFPVVFYAAGGGEADGFWFDDAGVAGATIAYSGGWRSYPVIEIDGPYAWLTLQNATTGASLTLSVSLAAGVTLTIDLTPGAQAITDNNGNNRLSDLSAGSLIDWYLDAGDNAVKAYGSGTDGNTAIRVKYFNRYIAL